MPGFWCVAHKCWTLNNNRSQNLNKQLRKLSSLISNSTVQTKPVSRQSQESVFHNDDHNETQVRTSSQSHKVLGGRVPSKFETTGIISLIGNHAKVTGTVKERNSHFHVHEIDLNGQLVQLTDLDPPPVGSEPPRNDNGDYFTHCTLYKEGISTIAVNRQLSNKLQINYTDIDYAGRKDTEGFTSQRISVRNVNPHHLIKLSNLSDNFKLGNFSYSSASISAGELQGNHFHILLRDVQTKNSSSTSVHDAIKRGMDSLSQFGFINYCGPQRMEVSGVPAFAVGRALMQENWEKFFDLMLTPLPDDRAYLNRAKILWSTVRDPVQILNDVPNVKRLHRAETKLLMGLAKFYKGGKGELVKAVQQIPILYRNLYMTSFQSHLWNHVATYRLKKFGLQPVPGDCVLQDDDDDGSQKNCPNESGKDDCWTSRLKILTDDDVHSTQNNKLKYSIHDVVLPGPGQEYPRHSNPEIQNFYEKLLTSYGLDTEIFSKLPPSSSDRTQARSSFCRHLLVKPKNVKYTMYTYSEMNQLDFDTLIPSDLGLLSSNDDAENVSEQVNGEKCNYSDTVLKKQGTGDKFCAVLEFSLRSAAYATMAIREVIDYPYEPAWPNFKDDFSVPDYT